MRSGIASMKSPFYFQSSHMCRDEEDIDIDESALDEITPEEIDNMLKEADKVEVESVVRVDI